VRSGTTTTEVDALAPRSLQLQDRDDRVAL